MSKLLTIIKREYVQRVRARMFIVVTILGPLIILAFAVVPALIFNIKAGGPMRLAVVDETGRLYDRVQRELLQETAPAVAAAAPDASAAAAAGVEQTAKRNPAERLQAVEAQGADSFVVERVEPAGRSPEQVRQALDERVRQQQLDAYLILPRDVLTGGRVAYHARNLGDALVLRQLTARLSAVVAEQRLLDAQFNPARVRELSRPIKLEPHRVGAAGGGGSGAEFGAAFAVGFFIYITVLMYGQVILGAVVEEKTTRITELLFSSVDTFSLMFGKLVGVSLVAVTQYAIWALAFVVLALYGAPALAGGGFSLPHFAPLVVVYCFLFFLLGYFLYATIYLLLGAMVTTTQEGGQLSMPIVMLLVAGIWLAVPVIRSPNSPFAVWVSLVPFFAPITMLVRIVTEPPPFWQIALSLGIGFGTVALLIWLAARVYRIGMLMYGKRASIPEVLRWMRQT